MSRSLQDLIADGRVHVLDGAMGTVLYSRGFFVNVCYDELNLKEPGVVRGVHEEYIRAGAEIIETNTFGANPVKLSGFGLEDRTEEINERAAELARAAAANMASVVGAIGPLGIRIEPFGPTSREEAGAFFERQVRGLLEGGVDGFILETFSDLDEIHAAYLAVRKLSALPLIAQMTIGENGKTSYGTDVETIARTVESWEPELIGLNCSVGPSGMLDAIKQMARVTERGISAQPNAGLPKDVGDRKIYLASPDYMATYSRHLIEAGARFVGGCCGTTPEHIKRIRDIVAGIQPRQVSAFVARDVAAEPGGSEPVPLAERSRWGRKIAAGEFVTSVEIVPPKGGVPDAMIERCRAIKEAGVDAVSVLDGPRAQSRMASVPSAMIIEREVGIETVFHYSCRDRNMMRMISDLLGAAAAGLHNILIITGDPPAMGPYPDTTAVFDIDSIGLTNVVNRLNRGLDPGGNPIGGQTQFVTGVALNPCAVDLERELSRYHWKVDAGAEFAVTQPVFDPQRLESFLERARDQRIPVIAELWPLVSLQNAEFLANEVPGVAVPDAVLERMRNAQSRGDEAALAEGIAIAREVLDQIRDVVVGAQITAPFDRVEVALAVLAG